MSESEFIEGYIECAIWASNDDRRDPEGHGVPLDENYDADDLTPECRAKLESDCRDFMEANSGSLALVTQVDDYPWDYAGHDFWLTRNGHGAGFWDRYYGGNQELRAAYDQLSEASRICGSFYLHSTEDGKVVGYDG